MPAQTFDTCPHVILVAHGALGTSENWSCGLRTTKIPADVPQADLQTLANAATAAWAVAFANGAACFSSNTFLGGVTARSLDARGLTTTLAEGVPGSAVAGTTSGKLPDQCATVLTLHTARAGRTGKGRIYLPLLAIATQGDGLIPSGTQTAIAAAMATLIESINTALGALSNTPLVGVQSKTSSAQDGGAYTGAAVTSVSVGNVIDTQQRRRKSLVEVYATAAVA